MTVRKGIKKAKREREKKAAYDKARRGTPEFKMKLKAYYEANKERIDAAAKVYRMNNKIKIAARARKYGQARKVNKPAVKKPAPGWAYYRVYKANKAIEVYNVNKEK